MNRPKPLYYATISYRTRSGRKVLYSRNAIAGDTLAEVEERLRGYLDNEHLFGRRKVATVLDDFHATYIGHQIATK